VLGWRLDSRHSFGNTGADVLQAVAGDKENNHPVRCAATPLGIDDWGGIFLEFILRPAGMRF
jgi:hypothetical protein